MKKLFASILVALSFGAHAAVEGDYIVEQIGSDTFSKIPRVLTATSVDGLYYWNAATKWSSFIGIGSGLAISSGTLMAVGSGVTINDAPGRSLVTSTTATGFQISTSKNARVCYEGSFSTTSTIGGPSGASVFLETADTNSTNAGDWTIKAQQSYGNTITLAIVLNQVQANNWSLCRDIPAAKFVRLRSGSISGTASVSINSAQQETTY